jgi:hypothetical protein
MYFNLLYRMNCVLVLYSAQIIGTPKLLDRKTTLETPELISWLGFKG